MLYAYDSVNYASINMVKSYTASYKINKREQPTPRVPGLTRITI